MTASLESSAPRPLLLTVPGLVRPVTVQPRVGVSERVERGAYRCRRQSERVSRLRATLCLRVCHTVTSPFSASMSKARLARGDVPRASRPIPHMHRRVVGQFEMHGPSRIDRSHAILPGWP